MKKFIRILGDGQVWDLKRLLPEDPEEKFEDLFSGRALGEMAAENAAVFSRFKERGKITGLSVTRALLSEHSWAKNTAKALLENLAKNGTAGIKALNKGGGFKNNWSSRQRDYWKNLDFVIIGGGVSGGLTGRIIVSAIKKNLSKNGFSGIKVYQAKFPGKEAGFLGAVVNIIKEIYSEAKVKKTKLIAACGLDLGRDEIGAGLLVIDAASQKVLKQKYGYWVFRHSVKVPYKNHLKKFLDARSDYGVGDRRLGWRIRMAILKKMAGLIIRAQAKAQRLRLPLSGNIGVAVPGSTTPDGFILDSTDYLPFFKKRNGFNFAENLEGLLAKRNLSGVNVHLVNDGIAAGIANIYFDSRRIRSGKFAFLGIGSGLGGCAGLINTK